MRDGLVAGAIAAVVSGAPSTVHAVATGRDVLETVRAAGSILLPGASDLKLIAAAPIVHGALSLGWGAVLGLILPRRRTVAWGAAAGLAIGAFDLGLARRWFPLIGALPPWPQFADHLAYGVVVGAVLSRRSGRRP